MTRVKGLKGYFRFKGLSYKRTGRVCFLVNRISENPRIKTIDLKRLALEYYRKFEPDLTPRTIERDIKEARKRGFLTIKKRKCRLNLPEVRKYRAFSFLLPIGRHDSERFISSREFVLSQAERFISPSELWKKVREDYRMIATVRKLGLARMVSDRSVFKIMLEIHNQEMNATMKKFKEKTLRKQFERDLSKMIKSDMLVFNSKKTKVKENHYIFYGRLTKAEKKKVIIEDLKMLELQKDIKKYGYERVREMKKWKGRIL